MKFEKVYNTQLQVGIIKTLYVSLYVGMRIRLHLIMGKLNLRRSSKYLYDFYESKRKIMHMGALTDSILNEWKSYNKSLLTPVLQRTIEKTEITNKMINEYDSLTTKYSKQQRVAGIVNEIIKNKKLKIKTVCHIGARVDTISNFFSKKFSKINFHSIDLQENLKVLNSKLGKRKNWKVHNGYALKLFKQKKVKADFVMMLSTSPKFNNKEFHQYIETFQKTGVKCLLFFEPWWALPFSFSSIMIKRPESIDQNLSPIGGMTADFHHNYFAVLVLLSIQWCDHLLFSKYPLENLILQGQCKLLYLL